MVECVRVKMFSGASSGVVARAKTLAVATRRATARRARGRSGAMGFCWVRVWALAPRYQVRPFWRRMGPKNIRRDLILLVVGIFLVSPLLWFVWSGEEVVVIATYVPKDMAAMATVGEGHSSARRRCSRPGVRGWGYERSRYLGLAGKDVDTNSNHDVLRPACE